MKSLKIILMLMVVLTLSLSFTSCIHSTENGHASVIMQKYGSSKGIQPVAVGPGVYFEGFGETYHDFPTYQINWVYTKDATEGSSANEEFTFQTKDGMNCEMDLGIAMNFDIDKLPIMYSKYRKDVEEIRNTTVRNEIRDALNRVAGSMSVDYVYGEGKGKLIDSISMMVKSNLSKTGIIMDHIYLIGAIRIPDAVSQSINAKVQMTQDAEKEQNKVALATASANIAIAKARGIAEAKKIEADGEAYYNKTVAASITPAIIEVKRIEKWRGVYPTTYGVNGGLLIK